MSQIHTKTDLIKYIRGMLGEPLINVELTDTQISEVIDQTVQKFTDFSYDGYLEDTILCEINGKKDYPLPPQITNILKVSKGGSSNITNFYNNYGPNLVPDIWSNYFFSNNLTGSIVSAICQISSVQSILEKYYGDDINYNFNPSKKVLQVLDEYTGPAIIHYQYQYIPNDDNDYIFDHQWVKEYALAKSKFLWGSVVGKYSGTLVGGTQINYADLKSEAQQDIDRLNEELLTRWSDPAPVLVG